MWYGLVLGMTFGLAAAAMPGPLMAYLISQALNSGWRRTLPAAFAPLISDVPIALLVLLVLSQVPSWLETVLRFGGGLFLLYLAFLALRAWKRFDPASGVAQAGLAKRGVLKAAVVNWLNPGPYLGWSLVLGPLFLKGWREAPADGIAVLAGFYGVMLSTNVSIVLLFAAVRGIGPKVNRALLGLSALGLGCFGLYQLWVGAAGLLP